MQEQQSCLKMFETYTVQSTASVKITHLMSVRDIRNQGE